MFFESNSSSDKLLFKRQSKVRHVYLQYTVQHNLYNEPVSKCLIENELLQNIVNNSSHVNKGSRIQTKRDFNNVELLCELDLSLLPFSAFFQ